MPVAHIVNNCLHLPQGQQAQFLVPLKPGQDHKTLDIKKVNSSFLMPCLNGAGHVVSYSYNGAQRVFAIGSKVPITKNEAAFVMNRIPGLIELVDENDDGGNETISVLVEREKDLRRQLNQATTRSESAEAKVRAYETGHVTGDMQFQKLSHEREMFYSEAQAARQTITMLTKENEALRSTENGLLRVEFNKKDARIQALEAHLTPAQLKAVNDGVAPQAPTSVAEDAAVAAMRAREDRPDNTPEMDALELKRMEEASKATPQRAPGDAGPKVRGK